MAGSKRTLLKVVSVLFLIFGVFSVLTAVIGILGGGLIAAAGAPGVGVVAAIAVIIGCLGGILEFVAGIKGLQNKLPQCRALGMILLVLAVLGFIFDGLKLTWDNIVAIVLPVLYLMGAKQKA
ncbi:hypothetical protein MR810_06645 [bacterium]|nr:hypothetical protein [bacterium]MDD5917690.1 hypothetical protein [bacterium]